MPPNPPLGRTLKEGIVLEVQLVVKLKILYVKIVLGCTGQLDRQEAKAAIHYAIIVTRL